MPDFPASSQHRTPDLLVIDIRVLYKFILHYITLKLTQTLALTLTMNRRRRKFCIDTEVRCVGTHPPFWPLEPARVKPN